MTQDSRATFAEPHEESEPPPIDYRRITLNQIAPRRVSSCIYEYDFGDSWEHPIEVEEELAVGAVAGPLVVSGARACPPEDCGGPLGYAELLEGVRDPLHPEHAGWSSGQEATSTPTHSMSSG